MPPWEFILFVVFVPAFYALAIWDARLLLRSWAEKEGIRLCRIEGRLIDQGPFRHRLSVRQLVLFIRAVDRDQKERSGFVCCGHYLWGTTFGQVVVKWQEEPIQLPEPTSGLAPGRGSS